MSKYQSKYSKIITDEAHQSVNPNTEYHLTVEEYYDLTHHTHNASDIDGIGSGSDGSSGDVAALTASVNDLKEAVAELKVLIQQNATADEENKNESSSTFAEIKQNLVDLTQAVNNNTNAVTVQGESIEEMKIQINSLNTYVDQDIQYGETAEGN